MRSQRVGRFKGQTQAKPVPPLRERIDPTQKLLNSLDDMERELGRELANGMDSDEYWHLYAILEQKREAAIRRSERLAGVVREKPSKDTPINVKPRISKRRASHRPMTSKRLGRILFFGTTVFLFIKARFFA